MITVLIALCSLLFMQLAVAAYACPGDTSKLSEVAAMAEAGMPCASEVSLSMDDEQPGLCHAHCQSAEQTAEKLQPPSLAGVVALGLVFTIRPASATPPAEPAQAPLLLRATVPPIAVRHCCFRI